MKPRAGEAAQTNRAGRVLIVSIPVSFQQRGGRKQIVVPAGLPDWQPNVPRCDSRLIKAVVRAHHWRELIEAGKYASAAELSRKLSVNESYLSRLLRLTLLAPDIIEAILDGRQPKTLEVQALLKPFPSSWEAQRTHFGFI